jgi:maltose alpha-D-glucosyltransferase/alpha-amylase
VEGAACYPATEEQARDLTEFFTIEKALYEVRYELDNRPTWIDIPVRGLLQMAAPKTDDSQTRGGSQ